MISELMIQSGRGRAPVVFCIPGAADTVAAFLPLADTLAPDVMLYGLQPDISNWCASACNDTFVSTAADHCVRIMQRVAGDDPCVVVGHSFGGWVAFESAVRLSRTDRLNAAVILLDTDPPTSDVHTPYNRTDAANEFLALLDMTTGHRDRARCPALKDLSLGEQNMWIRNEMIRASLIPEGASNALIDDKLRAVQMSLNTNYSPSGSLATPLWLVQPHALWDREDVGNTVVPQIEPDVAYELWGVHARNIVRIRTPGNHLSLLRKPYISEVADIVRGICAGEGRGP